MILLLDYSIVGSCGVIDPLSSTLDVQLKVSSSHCAFILPSAALNDAVQCAVGVWACRPRWCCCWISTGQAVLANVIAEPFGVTRTISLAKGLTREATPMSYGGLMQ